MLVRKAFELFCDNNGVQGNNLKERIEALGSKITLPTGLFSGIDNIRLLGNDAAHVISKDYDAIEKPEVDAALKLAKMLFSALYQHTSITAELEALKKTTS